MASSGDALVNVLANNYADRLTSGTRGENIEDADLFDELEAFDDSAYRAARLQQLSSEIKAIKALPADHGTYLEVREEKAVLDITTSTERVVVHFFHPDFVRCKIMDRHLEILARKHIHTRFVRVNVDNCPFIVTKLGIQVLPCVMPFVEGLGRERVLGFEGLGGGDDFPTGRLEGLLRKSGVIKNLRGDADLRRGGAKKSVMGFAEVEDEEFDSDE